MTAWRIQIQEIVLEEWSKWRQTGIFGISGLVLEELRFWGFKEFNGQVTFLKIVEDFLRFL